MVPPAEGRHAGGGREGHRDQRAGEFRSIEAG